LEDFREIDKGTFKNLLDRHTLRLQGQIRKLDNSAFYWGSARKAINIFLATACYHAVLRREYDLDKIEDYMEIPLDSQVAKKLSTEAKKREIALSQWESLKHLPKNLSEEYQKFALLYAQELKCSRVQLDVLIWRAVNECEGQAQTRRA
jgi:hypothetical protein